jgi:hypothetical protein
MTDFYATCKRCNVGVDEKTGIACVTSAREEPEFFWCCVECLLPGDVVCDKTECNG